MLIETAREVFAQKTLLEAESVMKEAFPTCWKGFVSDAEIEGRVDSLGCHHREAKDKVRLLAAVRRVEGEVGEVACRIVLDYISRGGMSPLHRMAIVEVAKALDDGARDSRLVNDREIWRGDKRELLVSWNLWESHDHLVLTDEVGA